MNFYADEADYAAGLINQRDEYIFDTYGRRSGWTRYELTSNQPLALTLDSSPSSSAADFPADFAAIRTEARSLMFAVASFMTSVPKARCRTIMTFKDGWSTP